MLDRKYSANFNSMKKAGKKAAQLLELLTDNTCAGISTQDLDDIAVKWARDNNVINAPLNYKGFPKSICTSVNHVVCHGIPNKNKILKNGDIINIDITIIDDGWHADTSRMVVIGKVSQQTELLINTTYECLFKGIEVAKPGNTLGDIGYAIQSHAESKNFSVVRDFCGHGIGKLFHTHPNILHYGKPNTGDIIKSGMIFTIEPMINIGDYAVKILPDQWTAVTKDKSLSAQFEHTIGITENDNIIFTLNKNDNYIYRK